MSKPFLHAIILICTICLAFVYVRTPLVAFDLQIIAFLFIVLYFSRRYYLSQHTPSNLLESVVFTFVVLTIILTSGGVSSPFFFLLHFLLFALSLFLAPQVGITATVTIMTFLIFTVPFDQGLNNFIPILSIGLLSPFALFMGQLYLDNHREKELNQKCRKILTSFIALFSKIILNK